MLQLKPLDDNVPIFQQIGTEAAPVVLVNVFQVAKEDIPAWLERYAHCRHGPSNKERPKHAELS